MNTVQYVQYCTSMSIVINCFKSSIFNFYVVDDVKEHKQTKQKKISLILRSVRIQLSKIGQ